MSTGGLGLYALYGIVLLVVTLVALFTKGWSRGTIIALLIAWLPFAGMSVLIVLGIAGIQSGGNLLRVFRIWLLFLVPLGLVLGVFLLLWKWMQRFRD